MKAKVGNQVHSHSLQNLRDKINFTGLYILLGSLMSDSLAGLSVGLGGK